MKKIVIINSILSPYSNERYNELNKNPNVDLYVLFHAKLDNARGWDSILLEIKYKKINLKNIHISLSSERVSSLNINYNTYAVLKRINPDRVIICGWDSIATFLALIYCKINKKELILWAGSTEFEKSWLRIISKFYVK